MLYEYSKYDTFTYPTISVLSLMAIPNPYFDNA